MGRTEREGFPESTTSLWVEQDGKGMENRDGSTPGFPRRAVHACVLCVWTVHSHRNTPLPLRSAMAHPTEFSVVIHRFYVLS